MLYIDETDIRKIFTMRDAIESDREAFILQSQGFADAPVRTNFNVEGRGITSLMPGYVSKFPRVGIKIVSTYPQNAAKGLPAVPATVLLCDADTGELCAVLDGTELTRMRTGAVSGLATELLSNENAETGALFGTGGQAFTQLEAMLTVRSLKEVRVFDKERSRLDAFMERSAPLAEKFGVAVKAAASSDEAIDNADVITTVTTSALPTFDGRKVKKGAHINAVGVFTPDKRELDEYIVTHADRIFIDNREAVMSEAGDFLIPISEGRFSEERINGELGDLLLGRCCGRKDPAEITLMKTVGFATLDIVIAHKVYEKAAALGCGRKI
ncbi:MAG: ornithine cyclodeaminase family protein [Synergistes sp.]|nr:ornithine cyclodeaminase family protein [Synergistes sp.]